MCLTILNNNVQTTSAKPAPNEDLKEFYSGKRNADPHPFRLNHLKPYHTIYPYMCQGSRNITQP